MKRNSGNVQDHGADVYDLHGRLRSGRDFSSTVPSLPPPAGWKRRASGLLGSLQRYPRPYARGLDTCIAASLGLPAGSVLPANGASEALDWCARLASGRRARLLAPCFGGYRQALERSGARVDAFWWDGSVALDFEALLWGLKRGDHLWLANPGNPLGQVLPEEDLVRLAGLCVRRGLVLVLDEALRAQRLDTAAAQGGPGREETFFKAVVVRSLGKGLGLPGLRLGYVAAAPNLVGALRRFQDPWSLNGLAQEMGAWALAEERRLGAFRRRKLAARSSDLALQMARLRGRLKPRAVGSTGYFCVDLGAPVATTVAARLSAKGFFVRDASSFGPRAAAWLRLNPRSPGDNRALVRVLELELKKL